MELLTQFIDLFLHLDKHLTVVTANYGAWVYLILFLIVFCETGLVVMPILPGDSLLFAAGALASLGELNVWTLCISLTIAAVIGDTVNYHIGKMLGPKVFGKKDSRFFKQKHLEQTQKFYEKYGGKTIIIARFMPIIRTFAPFVAGIGTMQYSRFIQYNIVGAVLWVFGFVFLGYGFGQHEFVKKNFSLVILAIIILSVMPGVIEFIKAKKKNSTSSCKNN